MASKSTEEQPQQQSQLCTAREKTCNLASCRSTDSKRTTNTTTTSTALLQHGAHTQPTTCCTIGCPTKANWLARLLLHVRGYRKTEHHHHTEPSFAAPRSATTSTSGSSRSTRNPSV